MKLYKPNYNKYTKEEKFRIKEASPTDAIVKINSNLINSHFNRNEWVKLSYSGKSIYRIIRGASVRDLSKDKIWLSYDSTQELGIVDKQDSQIIVTKATLVGQILFAPWNTPNIVERNLFRAATILGLLSMVLGILGVVF